MGAEDDDTVHRELVTGILSALADSQTAIDAEDCAVAEDGDHCAHWYNDKKCCHCQESQESQENKNG